MNTKKSLEQEVIEDLEKTGFGSEMRAMKIFISRKWKIRGSPAYFDLDEKKTRETDLVAYHTLCKHKEGSKEISAQSFFQIVAEVKKTEKPWVIFKENPQNNWRLQEGWTSLLFCNGLSKSRDIQILTNAMLTSGLACKLGWFGYGIHESFKKPDKPSRWYSALASVCKAGEHGLKANSLEKESFPYFFFVKPVIILDGALLAASIDNKGDISVEKIDASMVEFGFATDKYKERKTYKVDIITLQYLEQYLDFCEKRNEKIFDELLNHANCVTVQPSSSISG